MPRITLLYTRVSSDKQADEGNSLVTQKRMAYETFAPKNDLEIVQHFEDAGESAKTANRPELINMLKYIAQHKGEVDAVLVYKVDRLARNAGDFHAIKQLLSKEGVALISMTENFDDTPMGRAMEGVSSIFAQLDNEIRAERSKNGMIEGVREGRWQWKAPIGFINTRIDGKKNIAPDPDEEYIAILKRSWRLIADGYNLKEARKIVNIELEGIGRPPLRMQTFSRMIDNVLYVGIVQGFGLRIQSSSIKPFVDPALFYEVQDIKSGNRNKGNRYMKTNPKYPLRGILYCKNGHKLTASSPRGRSGNTYPKYHCPKCRGQGTSYDVADTEQKFMKYTSAMSLGNDIKAALQEAIRLNLGETHKQNAAVRKKLEKDLISIKAERDIITDKIINGVIPDAVAKERYSFYDHKELETKMRLNEISTRTEDAEELMEFGISKLSNIAQTFQEIEDIDVRSRFQKWLFPAGLAYDGEKFGTTQIPLIYRVNKNALAGAFGVFDNLVILPGIEPGLPG